MTQKNLVTLGLGIGIFVLFLIVNWNNENMIRLGFILLLFSITIIVSVYETYWIYKGDNDDC